MIEYSVTQDDIDQSRAITEKIHRPYGTSTWAQSCPIAFSLRRVFGMPVLVSSRGVFHDGKFMAFAGDEAKTFVKSYDAGLPVSPFSSTLDTSN